MVDVLIFSVLFFRKKKLTDHWRRFIHPIMWRCKWVELQLKEIRARALKYDSELAQYDQTKKFESEKSTLEGFNAVSQPFSCPNQGNQLMKRKKRKRVEEITDLASYMSQHNLFSYYGMNFTFLVSCRAYISILSLMSIFPFCFQNIRSPMLMVLIWKMIMVI